MENNENTEEPNNCIPSKTLIERYGHIFNGEPGEPGPEGIGKPDVDITLLDRLFEGDKNVIAWGENMEPSHPPGFIVKPITSIPVYGHMVKQSTVLKMDESICANCGVTYKDIVGEDGMPNGSIFCSNECGEEYYSKNKVE